MFFFLPPNYCNLGRPPHFLLDYGSSRACLIMFVSFFGLLVTTGRCASMFACQLPPFASFLFGPRERFLHAMVFGCVSRAMVSRDSNRCVGVFFPSELALPEAVP